MVRELIEKCRSYRRYQQNTHIGYDLLKSFIKNASITPSASNLQPLKYKIVNNKKDNDELFKQLKWAGFLKDWDGPSDGERPAAYIMILGDNNIVKRFDIDLGISAYAISLSAAQAGIGSCMIGSVNRDNVREYFDIPGHLDILLVISLGYPNEEVVLEKAVSGDIKYYRDADDVHHVPKRNLSEILLD